MAETYARIRLDNGFGIAAGRPVTGLASWRKVWYADSGKPHRPMFEHRKKQLLSTKEFIRRVSSHFLLALGIIGLALGIGVVGYHVLADLGWVDSLLNASMILGGMGPVDPLKTDEAKVFASCYALFSGLVFIGVASLLIAPFAHRILHRFHLDENE